MSSLLRAHAFAISRGESQSHSPPQDLQSLAAAAAASKDLSACSCATVVIWDKLWLGLFHEIVSRPGDRGETSCGPAAVPRGRPAANLPRRDEPRRLSRCALSYCLRQRRAAVSDGRLAAAAISAYPELTVWNRPGLEIRQPRWSACNRARSCQRATLHQGMRARPRG